MRAAAHCSPPCSLSQRTCSSSITRPARAGVLYVWCLREFSTAVARDRTSGIQRSEAAMRSTRSRAAGEKAANQIPPSLPKFFWGEK